MKSLRFRTRSTAAAHAIRAADSYCVTWTRRFGPGLLVVILSLCCSTPSAGQRFGEFDEDELRQTRLAERLVHDGELARLLNLARAEIQSGRTDTAVAALRQLFASPIDTFFQNSSGEMQSLRRASRDVLITAPATFRRAWRDALEPVAGRAMAVALQQRSFLHLRRTADQFPLTESGFRAHVVFITHLLDTGSLDEAAAAAEEFASVYAATVFGSRAGQAVIRWESVIRRLSTADGRESRQRFLSRTSPVPDSPASVSRPWPIPQWSWEEDGAPAPLHFRPALNHALDRLRTGGTPGEPAFSDFSPLRWEDLLVVRTPLRVVALQRSTGEIRWQINTQTTSPEVSLRDAQAGNSLLDTGAGSNRHIDMGVCGMMAAEPGMLFFVDGFDLEYGYGVGGNRYRRGALGFRRPIVPQDPLANSGGRRRNAVFGTRLVALSRTASGDPVVAWIVGEQPETPYTVVRTSASSLSGGSLQEDPVAQQPLQDHEFYSAPCGDGDDLYILSLADEQVFLNCIRKAGGQVVWQQPVCMQPESAFGIQGGWDNSALPGRCLHHRDNVICCIADGIVISVSASTGGLNWAKTIESAVRQPRMPSYSFNQTQEERDPVFVPVLHEGKLIWSSPASTDVYCLDAATGAEVWHVSKQAAGPGNIASSADAYCAGVRNNQVIMIGRHHCRSLAVSDGVQNWSVELREQSGRAICDDRHCLIPELPDGMTLVSLDSGRADRVIRNVLPADYSAPTGAVSLDPEFVTVTTPGGVTQFRRADVFTPQSGDTAEAHFSHRDEIVAVLLAEGPEEAIRRSREILSRNGGGAESAVAALSAELALQLLTSLSFADHPDSDPEATHRILSLWEHLRSLPLTPAQHVRATLVRCSLPTLFREHRTTAQGAASRAAWHKPQMLNNEWSVRPDLLLQELTAQNASVPGDTVLLEDVLTTSDKADTILFASGLSTPEQSLQALRTWSEQGRTVDAELLASVLVRRDEPGVTRSIQTIMGDQPPGTYTTNRAPRSEAEGLATAETAVRDTPRRDLPLNFVVTEEQVIGSGQPMLEAVLGARPIGSAMFNNTILLCLGEYQQRPVVFAVDLRTGAVVDRVEVPPSQSRFATPAAPQQAPGLLVMAGETSITAVHCQPGGQLRRLWIRRLNAGGEERFVRRLGMFGPDFLVWQSESRLHCSHPLTGEDLWSRECSSVEPGVLMLSPPLLFGDEDVTVTVGADMRSWTSYSTRTGRIRQHGGLALDRSQSIVATGSRLIGVANGTSDLQMVDLSGGGKTVSGSAPLELAGDATFRVLPSGQVVAISRDREIVVLDPSSGDVLTRTSVADTLENSFIFGFTAFERNGKLLVAVNDERGFGQNISAAPRLGEPRCDFGRLYCIDRVTGKIDWQRRTQPMVFTHLPDVDLLVGWSHVTSETGLRRRTGRRSMRLRIYDLQSGDLLGSHDRLIAEIPFLCLSDAATGALTLHTSRSRVVAVPAHGGRFDY